MRHIALAFTLARIETEVSALIIPLLAHTTKIRLYPSHPSVGHWNDEITAWLLRIRNFVTSAKTPTGSVRIRTLAKWLVPFGEPWRMRDNTEAAVMKYGEPQVPVDFGDTQERLLKVVPLLLDREASISTILLLLTS